MMRVVFQSREVWEVVFNLNELVSQRTGLWQNAATLGKYALIILPTPTGLCLPSSCGTQPRWGWEILFTERTLGTPTRWD
jgi:hypothetical protein